ncbi:hypothetical protein [Methanosphaera cuniculi]|uniref:hypothetical protein n=1 Tax=Methanosphaera cuniculi TaxID=1077256 RepID=UPI0026E9C3C8|nr:hypothetical protein [Methanosphaera cuniculi]
MIKIKNHDGPARIGQINETSTPNIIDYKKIQQVENIPTPFKIQKEIAQENIEKTIKLAENEEDKNKIAVIQGAEYTDLRVECAKRLEEKGFTNLMFANTDEMMRNPEKLLEIEEDKNKIAVIQGAEYTDLRVECAKRLEEKGFTNLMFANTDEMMRNPEKLLEIIIEVRENINPNTTLYFPFATTQIIPILAYLGIDMFDTSRAIYEAKNKNLMTNTNIYPQDEYQLEDDLIDANLKQLEFTIKEVQQNMKNKTLRNLTEQRACTNPELMTLHRLLDKNHQDYLQKYTQLY